MYAKRHALCAARIGRAPEAFWSGTLCSGRMERVVAELWKAWFWTGWFLSFAKEAVRPKSAQKIQKTVHFIKFSFHYSVFLFILIYLFLKNICICFVFSERNTGVFCTIFPVGTFHFRAYCQKYFPGERTSPGRKRSMIRHLPRSV